MCTFISNRVIVKIKFLKCLWSEQIVQFYRNEKFIWSYIVLFQAYTNMNTALFSNVVTVKIKLRKYLWHYIIVILAKYKLTSFCCNTSPIYRAPSSPILIPPSTSCLSVYEMNEWWYFVYMKLLCFVSDIY